MISCAVTAQMICTFVFIYAKIRFSHDGAHILLYLKWWILAYICQICECTTNNLDSPLFMSNLNRIGYEEKYVFMCDIFSILFNKESINVCSDCTHFAINNRLFNLFPQENIMC